MTVTGRDGKKYPAKKKKSKKSARTRAKKSPPTEWAAFLDGLSQVTAFVKAMSTPTLPEGEDPWEVSKLLKESSRILMGASSRLLANPR